MISIIRVHIGIIGAILGLYRDNGKENGNYHSDTGVPCLWPSTSNLRRPL